MSHNETQVMTVVQLGRQATVASQEDYFLAAEILKGAKALIRAIKDDYKPQKQAADKAKEAILDAEKAHLDPLESIVAELEGKMLGWKESQARIAASEQARLAAEAMAIEESAALAAEAGDYASAEALSSESRAIETQVVAITNSVAPAVAGISNRLNWHAEIVDVNLIPRKYLLPDMVQLNQIARRMEEKLNIPGVRAVGVPSLAVRS